MNEVTKKNEKTGQQSLRRLIIPVLYSVMALGYSGILLLIPETELFGTVRAAMFLIPAGALLFSFVTGRKLFKPLRGNREKLILSVVFTVLFVILFSAHQLLRADAFDLASFQQVFGLNKGKAAWLYVRILSVPLLICSSFFLILGAECLRVRMVESEERDLSDKDCRSLILKWMIVTALAGVTFCFANFPFRASSDPMVMWVQYLNRQYSDWHTIGYQLFVEGCIRLFSILKEHPFSVCIVQTVIWIIVVFQEFQTVRLFGGKRKSIHLLGTLNLIFFQPMMYLGMMVKDTVFSLCMLGMLLMLFRMVKSEEIRKRDLIAYLLYASGTALFRHAAVYVVVFTGIVFSFFLLRRKRETIRKYVWKCALMIAVPALAFGSVNLIGKKSLNMAENPLYTAYTVPIYMSAAYASRYPEALSAADLELLESIMPIEEWQEGFERNPYWADEVTRSWGIPGERVEKMDVQFCHSILKMNLRLFAGSPVRYIDQLTDISSIIWEINEPKDSYTWASNEFFSGAPRPEITDDTLIKEDLSKERLVTEWNCCTVFWNAVEYPTMHIPVLNAIYYRGGIWLFFILTVFITFCAKKLWKYVLPLLPVLIFEFLYIISCPCQDFRYALPLMECGVLLSVLLFGPAAGKLREVPSEAEASESVKAEVPDD